MSLNAEKVFAEEGLPIFYVKDVQVSGSFKARNRVFQYKDKKVFSPEIVAVLHLEEQGHTAVWSEGLALELIHTAIFKYLDKALIKLFEVKSAESLLKRAEDSDIVEKYSAVSVGLWRGVIESEKYSHIKLNEELERLTGKLARPTNYQDMYLFEEIMAKSVRQIMGDDLELLHRKYLEQNSDPTTNVRSVIGSNVSAKKEEIEREVKKFEEGSVRWIRCIRSLEGFVGYDGELIDISYDIIGPISGIESVISVAREAKDQILRDPMVLREYIQLPEKDDDKTNPHRKFINEHTLNFARLMLEKCDIENLFEICKNIILPRWDLTVIDRDTKCLRFIEVKLDDSLTEYQARRLPEDIKRGIRPELCVVVPDKV